MRTEGAAFTAAQIAAALGVSPQSIRQRLERMDATKTREVIVRGQAATAWPVEALPADLQSKLAVLAERLKCRDITELLLNPPKRWQPEIPLADIAPRCIEAAIVRRNVLAPILQNCVEASVAELVCQAREAFSRTAGYKHKHDRTIRRWIETAQKRDDGLENWERLELYLDEHPIRRPTATSSQSAAAQGLTHLQDVLESLENPAQLTAGDVHLIWVAAMVEMDERLEMGQSERRAQRPILRALHESGIPIAKGLRALRKALRRKREQWLAGDRKPSAIADKRPVKSGHRPTPISENDRVTILARTIQHGGRVSEGFREAIQAGELSLELTQRHIANPTRKSYVPQRIRDAVTPEVRLLANIHHGPQQAELGGAYLDRDWSAVAPGDWWQGDDLTAPVYYWEETPSGMFFGRGQLLMMIDVRSTFILGWLLHSERVYNARIIRSLITQCHDVHGLPRRGFYFERGIWKSAKLISGSQGHAIPLQETELGLREYCEFRYARTPRAKVIERILGLVQNKMENLPGYVGRDERHDHYERVEKLKQDVEAERIHPSKAFLEKKALMERYQEIFFNYNRTPQGGKMLSGVSPEEMYETRQTKDIVRLDSRTRYLLANHRMRAKITGNGIRLPNSMGGGVYRNADTGRLIGWTVMVWVDVDHLDAVWITDLNGRNPAVVERADPVPAIDATPEQINQAMAQRDAHNAYAQTLYRVIRQRTPDRPFRQLLADPQSVEFGRTLTDRAIQQQKKRMSYARTQQTVQQMERQLNITPAPNNDPAMVERVKRGMELMKQALHKPEGTDADNSSKEHE
ncbi:MAG: Mu transposase C-terminal domain-containing protein [Verrucomicrobia bacterium]|nr:Mu transposase C-terminal domain-containing protein [Verrucomicrobiota bacterium]